MKLKPWIMAALLASVAILPVQSVEINTRCYPQPITLGVNDEGGSDAALIQGANLKWVRMTIAWRDTNPAPGVYNWDGPEGVIDDAINKNLKVLAILSTAPTWAGSNANGTLAPSNITYWQDFVRAAAIHFKGKVKAYEIWNEPNLTNSGIGVGWAGDLWTYPTYADYVRAAGIQIRTNAPGTLVVGPVTSSQPDARTVEVFRTLEEIPFPEGNASTFMDVVSFHANANGTDSSATIWSRISSQLNTRASRNPSNLGKPVWITEFGWKSNQVTETGQRDRIQTIVENMTSDSDAFWNQYPCGATTKFSHAFIYKEIDSSSSSQGIYRTNATAKPVVSSYLQTLPAGIHPSTGYLPITVTCSVRTCTFTSGYADPGDGSRIFDWDFGDGTTGVGRSVVHTYSRSGQFFVFHGTTNGGFGGDARLIQIP